MARTERVPIRLHEREKLGWEVFALEHGWTLSQFVRAAVDAFMEQHTRPVEAPVEQVTEFMPGFGLNGKEQHGST